MSGRLSVFYGPEIQSYYFGPGHPFNQRRVELAVELMRACGLFEDNRLRPIEQATEEDALLFHTGKYIRFLRSVSKTGEGYLDLGDTPAFPGCLDAALWGVGGTLRALDTVMSAEGIAFSVGGGFHHAHPGRASGFCILNDAAIALAVARQRYGVSRALYLDVDVHHGDGVFYGFRDQDWLLDVDFHESGRYIFPGTGFVDELGEGTARGLKLNLVMEPFAGDDAAELGWCEVAEPAIRAFRPELLVVQCGADAHANDPLAHVEWSTGPYMRIARSVSDLARELCDGRLLLLGGGGYNPSNVCACWAAIALTVAGMSLPEETPLGWRSLFEDTYGREAPRTFLEPETSDGRALGAMEATVRQLRGHSPLLAS